MNAVGTVLSENPVMFEELGVQDHVNRVPVTLEVSGRLVD